LDVVDEELIIKDIGMFAMEVVTNVQDVKPSGMTRIDPSIHMSCQ
jgi:hypothetical protein